jgi:hypothetical protein
MHNNAHYMRINIYQAIEIFFNEDSYLSEAFTYNYSYTSLTPISPHEVYKGDKKF